MKVKRENCTCMINGRIVELKSKGLDKPTVISVAYVVSGNRYVVSETLKLKSKVVKLGFFPIGLNRVPVMGDTTVGSIASVSYNPKNPAEAYLTANSGRTNN